VLLLVLLMTATALTGWYLVDGRFTSAPALVALPQSRASQEAEAAGLEVSFQSAYSESVAKGTVIATDPDPGAKIRDGGTIVAVVSRGPERYPMPVVVGLSQPAAEAALMESTLAVGSITPRYSETVPAGTVVSASVPVGSSLKKKTAVDLVVSRGPKPIPVMNWSGKPTTAAVAALRKDGFTVTVAREHSASVPAGRVISQSPDSGTGVAKDTIALTSSRGPVMVTVPMVKAMGVRAATDVMRRAGFTVRTARVSQNYLGVGYVAYSDPAARSKAPKGSTITLYLV
jgi:serine/threonine-protein kinase